MLDKLGPGQEGLRGVPPADRGNGQRLSIVLDTWGGQFIQFTRIGEMIREQ